MYLDTAETRDKDQDSGWAWSTIKTLSLGGAPAQTFKFGTKFLYLQKHLTYLSLVDPRTHPPLAAYRVSKSSPMFGGCESGSSMGETLPGGLE